MAKMPGYAVLKPLILENWASATHEDCIRLSNMRPKLSTPPLICQLALLDEVKRGTNLTKAAAKFGVNRRYLFDLRRRGPGAGDSKKWDLPPELALLAVRDSF